MMNTEQIIKALECCTTFIGCYECPYNDIGNHKCKSQLFRNSLNLIKELQAHNKNLKKENKYLRESLADERKHKEDMEGSNEVQE